MANIQKRGENSWCFTVSLGRGADNKYIRRTKTIKIEDAALLKTKKKLQDYLEDEYSKFRQEVEAGEYIAPQKTTLAVFAEHWKEKYADKKLALKTIKLYSMYLDKRILPVLGHMKLEDIKPLHIVDFLHGLERKDGKSGSLSAETIQVHHKVLSSIFSLAVQLNMIKSNPVARVEKPKVTSKEVMPYDEREVRELFTALQDEPYHWRMMVILAVTTGLRRGELLGLEWKHVNLEAGTIDVSQSLTFSLKGEIVVKGPKTKKSNRKVSLPGSVLEELKDYQRYRIKELDAIRGLWQGGDYNFVFSHADGRPFHHERPYAWFRNFAKRHGLRGIRFHDLRHTAATLLINQGVHAKLISERLGHSSIVTTMNVYGHALRSADQAAADKLDYLFQDRKITSTK